MRVVHVIESIDPRSGGTSSAFLEIIGALGNNPALCVEAFAPRPPAFKIGDAPPSSVMDLLTLCGPADQLRAGALARRVIEFSPARNQLDSGIRVHEEEGLAPLSSDRPIIILFENGGPGTCTSPM